MMKEVLREPIFVKEIIDIIRSSHSADELRDRLSTLMTWELTGWQRQSMRWMPMTLWISGMRLTRV